MTELKVVSNATCTFCGCVCDDMELTVENDHITKAKNACVLGKAWFLNHHVEDRPVALIDGKPASLDDAVERAARILAGARYPIVYGLSDTTCEAQRVAVAIADRIGGCVDTTTSVCHGPSGMAFQGVGEVTCSLGEVKNRADLVIFWGSNPAESHPRHWGRYSTMPKGLFVPNGRKDRTVVLVDVRRSKSAPAADLFLQIKPRNDYTRFYAKAMRGHGNVTGADNVVSWSTGYPFGVSLGRGYPRFNPGEFTTADTLARGEADAALIVASDPMGNFSQPAREHLARIPYIALDPKETATVRGAAAAVTTATYGINTAGAGYRMDDVPIPLRPAFEAPHPRDEAGLKGGEKSVRE